MIKEERKIELKIAFFQKIIKNFIPRLDGRLNKKLGSQRKQSTENEKPYEIKQVKKEYKRKN